VGGALGVAIIGSVVTSIYASHVADLAGRFGLTGPALAGSKASLGGALRVAPSLGDKAAEFVEAVEHDFVAAISVGMRVAAVIIALTAMMVWRFLPARAAGHDLPVDDPAYADSVAHTYESAIVAGS
jgi:hypothetical protein